ncbi:hypothetical protein [Agrobacterium vitis]|uniref:Uncharacterized protein n=1 Tax=Agrobacterium vitis TaxID=373 RepID=A0AAE2RFE9_AGRVI|nr:hypothetical protein [Agrobacterium vitis]MBF2717503.1 hypothetical protein [Agrobacterium vitis]
MAFAHLSHAASMLATANFNFLDIRRVFFSLTILRAFGVTVENPGVFFWEVL